jgi:hypothetical protein
MDRLFAGPKRTYNDFKKQIPKPVFAMFDSLRVYCLSLGANVVEDIRAHRIVYGKSLSFRWFADLEPNGDSIIIKIQKDRKDPFQTKIITSEQELDALKSEISDAYSTIH